MTPWNNETEEIEPYIVHSGRTHHPETSVIEAGGVSIGAGHFVIIAGPCSVESREQLFEIAGEVAMQGATFLRGGAFKARTSPYDFQGLHKEGLQLLSEAGRSVQLPVVSEITDPKYLPLYEDVDILQVGARNMQNFELLLELGKTDKPILLKRGFSNTIRELLLSAEYIMSHGNERVILCERGIRTFETETRNTLDLSAIPALHALSHLPVLVDPSHATGRAEFVESMALAAVAAGADGLMIEVHNHPEMAMSDGRQALTPSEFGRLSGKCLSLRRAMEEMSS